MTAPTGKTRRPIAVAVAAVVVMAALTWLFWPAGPSGPTVLRAGSGPYAVRLSVENPRLGANSFAVEVTDAGGRPAALDAVTLEPVMPRMGHAIAPVAAGANGPGRYRTPDTVLPMSGQWEITVSLRGPAGAERLVFPLLVNN